MVGFVQGESKNCALVQCRVSPDATTMPVHDPLYNRQSDAGSLVFLCAVETLKNAKQLVRVSHVEARSVVAHEIGLVPTLPLTADFNHRQVALARVFERIGNEVDPNLPQQSGVSLARRQFAKPDLQPRFV